MNFNFLTVALFTAGAVMIAAAVYDQKPADIIKTILAGKTPTKKASTTQAPDLSGAAGAAIGKIPDWVGTYPNPVWP